MGAQPDRFSERVKLYSEGRIALYNTATRICPGARRTERRLLADLLQIAPGMDLCDTMAGGGYFAEGVDDAHSGRCPITCVEPSANFAHSIDPRFRRVISNLDSLALADASFDRVSNLAGTHHIDRRAEFFREAHRILRRGGRFVVADVLAGSAPATFLNGAVDRLSDIGHDGVFLPHGGLSQLLEDAGFTEVREVYHRYTWDFPDEETLVGFCKSLFRLTRASLGQVREEIVSSLQVKADADGCRLAWSLVYASGDRA